MGSKVEASGDRRWAGTFRVCPSCGGRNWVGQRRCRKCASLLVGVRAVSRPPAAMIGRRTADKVLTPRVRVLVMGALAVAVIAGLVVLKLFRTDGFQYTPSARASLSAPATPEPAVVDTDTFEEPPSTLDSTRALRAAERGQQLLAQGKVRAAISVLTEGARVLPDNAELAHTYGSALWQFGSRDRALFQFRKALKLAPDNAVYREDLGRALQAMGLSAEAAHIVGAPGLAAATLDAARTAADAAASGMPPPPAAGGNLGGAGSGGFKGRSSFTDADLQRGRVETPAPAPSPTDEPGR